MLLRIIAASITARACGPFDNPWLFRRAASDLVDYLRTGGL